MTTAIDFARSFLWWRVDVNRVPPGTITVPPPYPVNNARMPLDCLCTVTSPVATGQRSRQFALGSSCKTEAVGASQDIWPQPNADFVQVLSDDGEALGIKTYAAADQQMPLHLSELGMQADRQVCRVEDVFESARTEICQVPAQQLSMPTGVVEAILDNQRLTARTTWQEQDHTITLDYPVKTVNANEVDDVFQPDTGPVRVPDVSRPLERCIEGLQLAFIAFNQSTWAELLLRDRVPVAGEVHVWHYARARRIDCVNEVFALS